MPLVIQTKVIKPQRIRIDAVRLELLNELRRQGRAIREQYERTTRTWRNKPKFEMLISLAKGEASVIVGTDDRIYKFIDEGTRVRRAIMSRDWVSKTTPRVISSVPGRGHVVFISKSVNRPGIEAREFSKIIEKRTKKTFHRAMIDAVQRGVTKRA